MPIPHKKVMFVDIAKLDTELMQPAQSLLAVVHVRWPGGSRAFHPLSDEANHAPIFALGEMAQKIRTDSAVTNPLIDGRLNLNGGDFPGPDREFDEHRFAAFNFGMR
ncbi:hypothetical protein CDV31_010032 [Fusarium ambrosium]|uniref:Uncharacterized protein n=1 Tax=Fusarium ambrosium TaxID=131363 RepID=A0A428TQQ3_9HYPO|nr:hypothetical protein CDV31_010032 [Fusarium ambrosium]